MKKIDDYFCDKFQALSDWLEEETGKTCFWYAALCIIATVAMSLWGYFTGDISLFWAVFSVMNGFVYLRLIEIMIRQTQPGRQVANFMRHDFWCMITRLFCLSTIAFCLSVDFLGLILDFGSNRKAVLQELWMTFETCAFFFMSSTPKPWIGSLAGRMIDKIALLLFARRATHRM